MVGDGGRLLTAEDWVQMRFLNRRAIRSCVIGSVDIGYFTRGRFWKRLWLIGNDRYFLLVVAFRKVSRAVFLGNWRCQLLVVIPWSLRIVYRVIQKECLLILLLREYLSEHVCNAHHFER